MSTMYLAADPRSLAEKLAEQLDLYAKSGDFFAPVTIIVPNRYVRKWLRLWLARRLDVAINLHFDYLEPALWTLLKEVDPRPNMAPETVDQNTYRLMVLAVLLENPHPQPLSPGERGERGEPLSQGARGDGGLSRLQQYLQLDGKPLTRLSCRRAWHLADRLNSLVRDYEYDRQDALIQPWLRHELGLGSASAFQQMMERAQRALFHAITREPDGKRALLSRLEGKTFKTFPQYALELMMLVDSPSPPTPLPEREGRKKESRLAERVVHVFGFTRVNELHARTIGWLGELLDMRFYHLNVLASRFTGDIAQTVQAFREPKETSDCGFELLHRWGKAGVESMGLLTPCKFTTELLPAHEPAKKRTAKSASVLARLREHLLTGTSAKTRLPQDTSLQIVACPGGEREVETVYNSIVHNLQNDPALRQTDIAVLVTDMAKYRAPLQAVFERPPIRLQYNMVDFNAAGISMFGQALLGMLDLALESFSRSRVFQVILNPCFLARLGADRAQAMTWLEWAEQLGIYQGWDADEKAEQGYPRSPFYAWRLGLQRLRLGRFMDIADDDAPSTSRFGHVIPFADLASADREHLDAFCRAVEGLLPTLTRLRSARMSGKSWGRQLERLVHEFLDVPEDRPEEAQVRDEVLLALETLEAWDALHESTQKTAGLPLALAREYVQSQLEVLPGSRGDFLVGGVSIAALQPMRPLPFAVVYVLGLSEDLFPGSNALSSFDLRNAQRQSGDVRPAEQRLYDFLASILSAQQKLYLLYNNHDLQKDQPLLPAVPLQQLARHLSEHVVKADFETITVPAHADDIRFLDADQQPVYQDVLVQCRDADRCLALMVAERDERLALDLTQQAEWADRRREFRIDFAVASEAQEAPPTAATVHLSELKHFLQLPAQASLRRHLRVEEEDEEQELENDEPLVTPSLAAGALIRQSIRQLIHAATQDGVSKALAEWQQRFADTYADSRLRSQVPEEAFGAIDQASLLRDLQERIHGQGQIESFLREHAEMSYCGPVLMGESLTPLGAKLRFPALHLRPGQELPADAPRETRLVGATNFAWHAPGRFEILIVTNAKEIDGRDIQASFLEPALLHLALIANSDPNADGFSSQQWLAQREVSLHVSHKDGISTWTHAPGSVTSAEALSYFVALTCDFLDPTQFDLLPLDVICDHRELKLALYSDYSGQIAPDHFRDTLEDAIEEEREKGLFSFKKIPILVEMVKARVPADALAKVQRRFRLLDRGPASIRRQPAVHKGKKK